MKTYLVTGGAGFVGSSLALRLKRDHAEARVIAFDNLKRRGSELNLSRLAAGGVEFVHGDVRHKADLALPAPLDCLIECSAEASVLAGYDGAPDYVIDTNLVGAVNCLELARRHGATFLFLSTSRVYPIRTINGLEAHETDTRFELDDVQSVRGASAEGISEEFPLEGGRSIYGASKLAAELLIQEYVDVYGLRAVINRCGVLAGAWQMGKVDQGVVALWVARHLFGRPLEYIGYGGTGKQVRDVLHVDDLYDALTLQLAAPAGLSGQIYNVGGGRRVSVSLQELTRLCVAATGCKVQIRGVPETRPADIRVYLTDSRRVQAATGWSPSISAEGIVEDVARWITDHRQRLEPIFAPAP